MPYIQRKDSRSGSYALSDTDREDSGHYTTLTQTRRQPRMSPIRLRVVGMTSPVIGEFVS
jgi:hypothetical protein